MMTNTEDSNDDFHCCRRNFDGAEEGTEDSATGVASCEPWQQADTSYPEELNTTPFLLDSVLPSGIGARI
jgi:hypothetical protein